MLAALVLLLHALGACVSAQQMSLLPAASYQAQLLAQRDAITNWQAFASANNITGWEDDLNAYKAVPVCEWSGIACNSFDGSVTQLNWTCGDCVVQAEGTLAPEMAEISSLQELIISGQLISGTLPEAWSKKGMFTGLTTLLLDYNQLDGPLPASFGGADAFPNLVNMKLSGNFLTGTLPGSWGNFTGLEQLYLDYNTLTGDLPASWGAANAFRKLKALYIGNNAFASTLPAAWGSATAFQSLTDIALDSAAMIGTLPASWGSEGAWPKLFILELALNQITGLLPSAWAGNGAFPQLSSLSLSSNDLSGSIPAAWGNPSAWPSLEAVGLGNNPSLCGSVPPSLYASVCAAPLPFGTECVGTDLPACVASFPPATAEDVAALLAQKQAISNWDKLVSGLELDGWNESVQVCSWTGVGCTENGSIISVDLSCPSEEEVQDGAPACGQRAQGVLAPELASISTLQSLNFANLGLSGTLPAAWGKPNSFSNLNILTLDLNNLTGTLPDAFPRRLQTVSMGNNDLSGSLPQSWGDASSVPVLSYLYLAGNKLSGPLPGIWGSSEALGYLGYLDLSNNTISGTLPSAWGQNGSFPRLTELYLTNNNITGGLPDSWAAAGAFSKLSDMSLESNMLSGSIPEVWNATDALPSLQQLVLVGNEELCGAVPYTMLKPVCGTEPSQCDTNDEIPCVTPPPAQQDDSSSSSVPVGAIVGGVLGGLGLVAILLFFAFRKGWLRRRGAPVGCAKQDSTSGKAPSSSKLFGDSGDAESPGKGLPLVPPLDPPALTLLPGQAHEGRADSTLPLSYITTLGMGYEQSASGTSFGSPSDALPTTLSSSLHSLETDPMLSFISSRMGATRQHSGILPSPTSSTGFTSASAPLPAEVQQWEVQWEHIQLQRPIGRGSFGKVYLANWQATPVAVKILINAEGVEQSPSLELPDEVMKQLQEEAVVMSRMRHPNLVSFMGLCTLPPCILTEFCSRGSLYDVLRQASWSPEVASDLTWRLRLSMASDAARGLLYLHLRTPAIIHGDVKSPNMLVDRSWNVKVCDFNLSHVIFKYQHQPAAPSSDATNPTWLAPEVLSGQRATAAADVYSFALVLWELLTWKLPWSRMPPYQVRRAVLEGHRPELPSCDALPGPDGATAAELEEYCQLIRDCWAQDPEDRPSLEAIVPRLSAMLDQAVQTASSLDH